MRVIAGSYQYGASILHVAVPEVFKVDTMGRMEEHEGWCFAWIEPMAAAYIQLEPYITNQHNELVLQR
jgi:hypothetical protein